jgi:hypothetical protein
LPTGPMASGAVCWYPTDLLVLWLVCRGENPALPGTDTNKCR